MGELQVPVDEIIAGRISVTLRALEERRGRGVVGVKLPTSKIGRLVVPGCIIHLDEGALAVREL
jgi:hypothetical protein